MEASQDQLLALWWARRAASEWVFLSLTPAERTEIGPQLEGFLQRLGDVDMLGLFVCVVSGPRRRFVTISQARELGWRVL